MRMLNDLHIKDIDNVVSHLMNLMHYHLSCMIRKSPHIMNLNMFSSYEHCNLPLSWDKFCTTISKSAQ